MKLESPSLMDSTCNCLNLTDIDALVQKATNIEQKLMYLREHREYFIGSKKRLNTIPCENEPTTNKYVKKENKNENKNSVELNISDKCSAIKEKNTLDDEVVEVNKNDVIKNEIRTELIKELREKVLGVLQA